MERQMIFGIDLGLVAGPKLRPVRAGLDEGR
jgi:hypothetical protein